MKQLLVAAFASLFVLASASAAPANSASPKVGERIDNPKLNKLEGGKQKLVGKADVNILVFFRPDQDYSKIGLEQIARCEKDLAGKSVSWVAIVSDRYPAAHVKEFVAASGIQMPVLVDAKDKVYGKLGIALHPMVVLVDKDAAIAGYQPFRKVNFADQIVGRVRRQLGEIDDAELEKILNPPKADAEAPGTKEALRQIKLGRMLLKAKKYAKALKAADTAIEKVPELAAGYVLRGRIFAAQESCEKAVVDFDKALELDPDDSEAAEGKAACAEQ